LAFTFQKAIFIEGIEHPKLGNQETANTLFERGLQLCTELNNEEYQHRFKILKDINNNVPAEKLEATVLARIEYFEREDLYEYIMVIIKKEGARSSLFF